MLASLTGALFLTAAATSPAIDGYAAASSLYSAHGASLQIDKIAFFTPLQPRLDSGRLPLRDEIPMMQRNGFRLQLSAVGEIDGAHRVVARKDERDMRRMAHTDAFYPKAAPVVIGFRMDY